MTAYPIEYLESRRLLSDSFGAVPLSDLPVVASEYGPTREVAYNDDLLFTATDPATGRLGLWFTDGTTAGTRLLPIASTGDKVTVGTVGNALYYAVGWVTLASYTTYYTPAGSGPTELYVTTDLGKTSTDLGSIPAGAGFGGYTTFDGHLFFTASNTLYETNGTRAGTHAVSSALGVPDNGAISTLAVAGGQLYVAEDDLLLVSDGTANGTVQLSATANNAMAVLNDTLYFLATGTGSHSNLTTLWRTDGTASGTVDLSVGVPADDFLPDLQSLVVANGRLILDGSPQPTSVGVPDQLYASLGTGGSIVPVSVDASIAGDAVSGLTAFDDQALVDVNGQLWSTNGLTGGSYQALDTVYGLVPAGDRLFGYTSDAYQFYDRGLYSTHTGPGQVFLLGTAMPAPTPADTAPLRVGLTQVTTPRVLQMGSAIDVMASVTNAGTAGAAGAIAVQFFLSPDGRLADAVALDDGLPIDVTGLAVGSSKAVRLSVVLPLGSPLGSQQLLAVPSTDVGNLTATVDTTVDSTLLTTALSAPVTATVLGGGRTRTLVVKPNEGPAIDFTLSGTGRAAFTATAADSYQLTLTGAGGGTLTLAAGAPSTLQSLTVVGSLGALVLRNVRPNAYGDGFLTVQGNVGSVQMPGMTEAVATFTGNVGAASLGAMIAATIRFNGNVRSARFGNLDSTTVALNTARPADLSTGAITDGSITSVGPLRAVKLASWTTDYGPSVAFTAASIDTLAVTGAIQPSVVITKGGIGSARIGDLYSNAWTMPGNLGSLQFTQQHATTSLTVGGRIGSLTTPGNLDGTIVTGSMGSITAKSSQFDLYSRGDIGPIDVGDVYASNIFAGINLGGDGTLGGGDDTFAAATIEALRVRGEVQQSVITAGLSVADDTFPSTGGESLLKHSAIGSIFISGMLTVDSRILSASLPAIARINDKRFATKTDSRFQIVGTNPAAVSLTPLTNFNSASGAADVQATRGWLYFLAPDPATGKQVVWRSDGTAANTTPVVMPAGTTAGAITQMETDQVAAIVAEDAPVLFTDGTTVFANDPGTGQTVVEDVKVAAGSTITLLGFNGVEVTTGSKSELWEIDSVSAGAVDLGSIEGTVGAVAPGSSGLDPGFAFSIGNQIWAANDESLTYLQQLGTIPNATKIDDVVVTGGGLASIPTAIVVAEVPEGAGNPSQGVWMLPNPQATDQTGQLLLTATITHFTAGGPLGITFDAQRTGDDVPTLWVTDADADGQTMQVLADGTTPLYRATFGASDQAGFEPLIFAYASATSTDLMVYNPGIAIQPTTGVNVGDVGTYDLGDGIADYVGPGYETLFIAPTPTGELGLYRTDGQTATVLLRPAPQGHLITAGSDTVFEITAATATTPPQVYRVNLPTS